MPIGYTRSPRVTGANQEARTRRLSRSLTTGNNGTPMVFTLFSTEEQKIDASPVAANTAAQRPATRWFSTEFASNSAVDIGYWQNAGYISLKLMNTGATYWSVSYSSIGSAGANAILFMNSTGYMTGNASIFSFDAANTKLTIVNNSSTTNTQRMVIEQAGSGDASMAFLLTGGQQYTFGIDNSANDRLTIAKGNELGSDSNDILRLFSDQLVFAPYQIGTSRLTLGGSGYPSRDILYIYAVSVTMNTGEIARGISLRMPTKSVTSNGSYYIYGAQFTVGGNSHAIANGVTDSGSRIGFTNECYSEGSEFAGTLASQIAGQMRYGQGSASATGTITNSIGLHLQAYLLGGAVTNFYGIYQESISPAVTYNYFSGWTRISPAYAGIAVHALDLAVSDTVTNGTMRIYQGSTGDASIQMTISGSSNWSIGIDNSDSDTFKVSASNALGTTDVIKTSSTLVNIYKSTTFGESVQLPITTVAINTTLNATHYTVLVNASSAAITITLPTAASANSRVYQIKKIDSSANAVTIDGDGTEKIDGANTVTLSAQWNSRTIQSDGSAWYITATV